MEYQLFPFNQENEESHKQLIKEGHNPNEIAKIIRNDEIEKLQEISSQNDFNFNQTIEPSNYERYSFINQSNVSLIDYAAFFGSIQCFKYLLMNGANAFNAGKYAVASGNLEIIHLCEQNHSTFEGAYEAAIEFHRNEIFHYIYENKLEKLNEDNQQNSSNPANSSVPQPFNRDHRPMPTKPSPNGNPVPFGGKQSPSGNPVPFGGKQSPSGNPVPFGGKQSPNVNPVSFGGKQSPNVNPVSFGGKQSPNVNPVSFGGKQSPNVNPVPSENRSFFGAKPSLVGLGGFGSFIRKSLDVNDLRLFALIIEISKF